MLHELLGHRGAAGEAPENTLTGFAHAWKIGIRAFELDVRLTADQELVILHDENLARTTGAAGKVGDFTASQLAELDARAAFPNWPEKAFIPRLGQVFDAYHRQLRAWEIEIKPAPPEKLEILVPRLLKMIDQYGIADRSVISSFDANALEIVQRLSPGMRRAFISHFDQPEHLQTALRLKCYRVCIPHRYGSKAVAQAAHAAGLDITGWQGDTPEMLDILLDWDVDNITTNQPSLAMAYLKQRGIQV
jgi:glycerophosphoryl diester phosphodiesterase